MAMGVMSLAGSVLPASSVCSLRNATSRPVLSDKSTALLHPASSSVAAARVLSFTSSSSFSGVCIAPRLSFKWEISQRGSVVKVRAKVALGCTKRSRSRKSRARTSGFRVRLSTPSGRNVLRRRRAKGRKVLCPSSNPNSGPRA